MAAVSEGFPRRARLTRPSEYQRVFKGRLKSSDAKLTVLATGNQLDYARLGLAISRKVARRAVDRNRIKRIIRDSFRHWAQRLGGLDIVVLGRRGIGDLTNSELRETLEHHWKRLARRCERC